MRVICFVCLFFSMIYGGAFWSKPVLTYGYAYCQLSLGYRWLNLRKFSTVVKISKTRCYLTIHLKRKWSFSSAIFNYKPSDLLCIWFLSLHRGAFCQLPFRWIYYWPLLCHSSKSTGKETGKTHPEITAFRLERIFQPMRTLEFITGHMIYNKWKTFWN